MKITLANLKDATDQQVFDQVKTHMLTQGKQSKQAKPAGEACAYRGDNALMCAAGCLMTDDEYSSIKLDGGAGLDDGYGKNWGWLADNGYVPKRHAMLIGDLQMVHDDRSPENWVAKLDEVAIKYGLV